MPPASPSSVLLTFLLLSSLPSSLPDDPNSFVYAGCSQPKYPPSSPWQNNLNSVLASIANSATTTSYANFSSSFPSSPSVVYGLFQCRGDLPAPACASCVHAAINQLSLLCPSSSGASLQLRGCLVRYDNVSFLGLPDRTLLFRKCGQMAGQSPGARDAALAAVAAGGQGAYRAGRAGGVEAAAQCVEDQGARQCDECVASAVESVKGACGGAADAGEVYLGKCYVGFYYAHVGEAARGHAKESGKNIAIIVGISAAVLLLILLLFFLRRTTGGKG